jgi:hypothetical protein
MMKKSKTDDDIPILEFARRIADVLKADFMAVMDATDWEKTDPLVRMEAETYLRTIDYLAEDISITVRRLDKAGNKIRSRLKLRLARAGSIITNAQETEERTNVS